MENNKESNKVFFIAVTDKPKSDNRKYSDFIYELCYQLINKDDELKREIDFHNPGRLDMGYDPNIKMSLFETLQDSKAFIVLLDTLDGGFNPNVWFELGVVSTADKPILLIAQERIHIPFDVNDVKVIRIPHDLLERADLKNHNEIAPTFVFSNIINDRTITGCLAEFSNEFTSALKTALLKGSPFSQWYDLVSVRALGYHSLLNLFRNSGIIQLIQNPDVHAEYISGEENAFKALTVEVKNAVESVRTTRFGDQSIVSQAIGEDDSVFSAHHEFMKALYDTSKKKSIRQFDRIVCNNNPFKWDDVSQALMHSSKKLRLFVRKYNYNINFELVVIDTRVAFIHFYQTSESGDRDESMNGEGEARRHDSQTQRIKSTLKITGRSTCIELAKIFDRLHHRDFDISNAKDLSRTLLGVNSTGKLLSNELNAGCFTPVTVPPPTRGAVADRKVSDMTKNMLENALRTWNISGQDKVNMIIGLHLVHNLSLDYTTQLSIEEKNLFNETLERFNISQIPSLEIRDEK